MDVDDDTLMMLADGEIDGQEAKRLHARIMTDPALATRYAFFTQTSDWVKKVALSDPDATVSSNLETRIREMAATAPPEAENVVPLRSPATRWQPMTMAASLALAVGLSAGLFLAPDTPETSTTVLSVAIQERLGMLPSGVEAQLPDGRLFIAVASFTDSAGAFCREYATGPGGGFGYVSVACRNGADWSLRLAIATDSGNDGYAPASSLEALDAFYAATGASQPLSAEAERELLK
jgi:hypothetical protein